MNIEHPIPEILNPTRKMKGKELEVFNKIEKDHKNLKEKYLKSHPKEAKEYDKMCEEQEIDP